MSESSDASSDAIHSSSLREFWWILLIWGACFAWTIGYCRVFGYELDEPIALTFGMPSWAFWGVFVPWGIATIVSCWFALTQMQDHPLDSDATAPANGKDSIGQPSVAPTSKGQDLNEVRSEIGDA